MADIVKVGDILEPILSLLGGGSSDSGSSKS